jgi:hypothetical protein
MLRNLLITASALTCVLAGSLTNAEVYKTVDKNGRVTYTDVPPANTDAKPVELKTINNIPAPTAIPTDNLNTNNTNPQASSEYQVQILAPENGKTLLVDERSISVSVSLSVNLKDGDQLAYKLDGAVVTNSRENTYIIAEPPRGEHILTVDIVNKEGASLAQSNAVTVFVMRPLSKPEATPVPTK